MAYNVDIQIEEDHLHVHITGQRTRAATLDENRKQWAKVAELATAHGLTNILVITELVGAPSSGSAFSMAAESERFGWKKEFKLAIVDADLSADAHNNFTKMVAANRGFQVNVFHTVSEALSWLRQA
jgi:hypothetical protein